MLEEATRPLAVSGPGWEFRLGDCLALPFDDDSFDLVFCSPPYEARRSYGELEFDLAGEAWVSWATDCFLECVRVSRGLVAWVVEGETRDFTYSSTPFLLLADLHRRGVRMRKPCVYARPGVPGSGGPDWLRNAWEPVICATKRGRLPWAEPTAMGRAPKYKRSAASFCSNRRPNGRRNDHTYRDPETSNPGNVVAGTVGCGQMGWADATKNEAPFPEWLPDFFVRSFCPPGGIVLDPFSGSGTTVAAAVRAGRRGVGIDARESQVRLGETRLLGLSVEDRRQGAQTLPFMQEDAS